MNELDRILAKMDDGFMQPAIFKARWAEVVRKTGEGYAVVYSDLDHADLEDGDTITIRDGFGARLSAPGYMDCTDWSVFDTEFAAKEYLVDTYGDDLDADLCIECGGETEHFPGCSAIAGCKGNDQ